MSVALQTRVGELSITKDGRYKIVKSVLRFMLESEYMKNFNNSHKQLRFLNRHYPLPYTITAFFDCPEPIPDINNVYADINFNGDVEEIYQKLIHISAFNFRLDLPFKEFQDLKYSLYMKNNLSIRECLVLKILGYDDPMSATELYKYVQEIPAMLQSELLESEILDFLVILSPYTFQDLSLIIQTLPNDLGFIKNEAYTPPRIIQLFVENFGHIELDLSSNALSNTIIKAVRYWSEQDPFFNDCLHSLKGNILINPPYPLYPWFENLLTCLEKSLETITHCLCIFPQKLSYEMQTQLSSFVQKYDGKSSSVIATKRFFKRKALKRYAVQLDFQFVYFGKDPQLFKKVFTNTNL